MSTSEMSSSETLNQQQAEFYESRLRAKQEQTSSEDAAGFITNVWTRIRKNIQSFDESLQLDEAYNNLHREWVSDFDSGFTIDLGCFSGNPLSLELAAAAEKYIGVDLAPSAIAELQAKLDDAGLANASAISGDFFELGIPDDSVDLVYARGVLHHFEDPQKIADEVFRILKPGGAVVSLDPLATAPENRLARAIYRPFQSDAAWEWPFDRRSLEILDRRFVLDQVRGIRGLSKAGLVLSSLGARTAGARLGQQGESVDKKYAAANSWYLRFFCWNVMLRGRKPGNSVQR